MTKETLLRGVWGAGHITDVAEWYADNIGDARRILNVFGGLGRYASAVCNVNTHIDGYDVQPQYRYIVQGVFTQKEVISNVTTLKGTKGYMFATRYLRGIDDQSAGLIDWIAENGTLADKYALASAICSCTYRGTLVGWRGSVSEIWEKFHKALNALRNFVDLPGTFTATEGDVFEQDLSSMHYDLMLLDPPISSEVYSRNQNYQHLSRNIGGTQKMVPWEVRTFNRRIRQLLSIDVPVVLVKYQEGTQPRLEEFRKLLLEYGVIRKEVKLLRRRHNDWVFYLER